MYEGARVLLLFDAVEGLFPVIGVIIEGRVMKGELEVLHLGFGLYASTELLRDVRVLVHFRFFEDPFKIQGMAAEGLSPWRLWIHHRNRDWVGFIFASREPWGESSGLGSKVGSGAAQVFGGVGLEALFDTLALNLAVGYPRFHVPKIPLMLRHPKAFGSALGAPGRVEAGLADFLLPSFSARGAWGGEV